MLEGHQVKLRPLEVTDIERAYTWINDPEVTRYLDSGRYPSRKRPFSISSMMAGWRFLMTSFLFTP